MVEDSRLPPDETGEASTESGLHARAGDSTVTAGFGPRGLSRGEIVGPFVLISLIGEGGMGEVWLAEQKTPVRRRVAIKIVKFGMNTREVGARFASERQALALMNHPGIAQMFDAGLTGDGRPYFAMEYVAGLPITSYCDKHTLTTTERLNVFIQVCEAVQHAHRRAIIHRDLKPSNILVTQGDGEAVPKVIDFGVAKALSQRLSPETMFTRVGSVVGTPAYMSPEQADSDGEDIDTRTDVYSLGVVLYELLAGALPLDYRKLAFHEVLRKLREEDAPRPSRKVQSTPGEDSTLVAKRRRTEPMALSRQLEGDLDSITLKALEKERSRRYGAPSELASDIKRYLNHEPVAARPASLGYRAQRYTQRHKTGVFLACSFLVLLIGFSVTEFIQVRRVTAQRDRADRITQFMTTIFKIPDQKRGTSITAREILENSAKRIDAELPRDPEDRSLLKYAIAGAYDDLGLTYHAERLLKDVVQDQRRSLGVSDPRTLASMSRMGWVLYEDGKYSEADKVQSEALDKERKVVGSQSAETLSSMNVQAAILMKQGKYKEAQEILRRRFEIHPHFASAEDHKTLITALSNEGTSKDAETFFRDMLEIERNTPGVENEVTRVTMRTLGWTLADQHHYADAERVFRELVELDRRFLGLQDQNTQMSIQDVLWALCNEHRIDEAERYANDLDGTEPRLSLHMKLWISDALEMQARNANRQGRADDARNLLRQAFAIDASLHSDSGFARTWYASAEVATWSDHPDEAFRALSQAIHYGFTDADALSEDESLASLRKDPRFNALLDRLRHTEKDKKRGVQ